MSASQNNSERSAAIFRRSAEALHLALIQMGGAVSLPLAGDWKDAGEQARAWLLEEEGIRDLVTAYVDHWIDAKRVPEMDDRIFYWFRLRFSTSVRLLCLLTQDERSTAFRLSPTMTYEQFVRWMLVDWWERCGSASVMYSLLDKDAEKKMAVN